MKDEHAKSFVQFLLICSPQQLTFILKTLTKHQLQLTAEIIFNVIKGVCSISNPNKTVLMKSKRLIREIIKPGLTQTQRRKRLFKIKRFLPIFLEAYLENVS